MRNLQCNHSTASKALAALKDLIFFAAAFGLYIVPAFAQKDYKRLERANALFEDYSYIQAIEQYEKLLKKNDIPEAKMKLAECYRLTRDMNNAEKWYRNAAENEQLDSVYMYYYATVLKYNKNYDEAREWYLQYEDWKQDGKGAKQAKFIEMIHYFVRDSSKVEIKNMPFNSIYSDFSPAYFKDGLLFVSSRTKGKNPGGLDQWTGESFLDLYQVEKVNIDSASKVQRMQGFINSNFHEGPACYDAENNLIYFTRNSIEKGIQKRSKEGVLKIQIYTAAQTDNRWDIIENFSLNNSEYVLGHPSLAADGNRIFFASDMPGGFGGLDIYYADKTENGWSAPVNLGAHVNTQWNEMFPYIHATGTLYFASDGLPGLGGLDVYSVRFGGRSWADVKNLGYPINSSQDDFGFILDATNKSGYVSSNREGGMGSDDIYSVLIKDTYFEEGVLLAADLETMDAPEEQPEDDFDAFGATPEPEQQFLAGIPVAEMDDDMEEALMENLYKGSDELEEELAGRVMREASDLAAAEEETLPIITEEKTPTKDFIETIPAPVIPEPVAPAKSEETVTKNIADKKSSLPSESKKIIPQSDRTISSLETAAPVLKAKKVEGLLYRVQIGAYSSPLKQSPEMFFKMQGVEKYTLNDGIDRYLSPNKFSDYNAAEKHRQFLKAKGMSDAFVVPFYNGKRISNTEVSRLLTE